MERPINKQKRAQTKQIVELYWATVSEEVAERPHEFLQTSPFFTSHSGLGIPITRHQKGTLELTVQSQQAVRHKERRWNLTLLMAGRS